MCLKQENRILKYFFKDVKNEWADLRTKNNF